jgi:hypothetical protein
MSDGSNIKARQADSCCLHHATSWMLTLSISDVLQYYSCENRRFFELAINSSGCGTEAPKTGAEMSTLHSHQIVVRLLVTLSSN